MTLPNALIFTVSRMDIKKIFIKSIPDDSVEYFLYSNPETKYSHAEQIRVTCLALSKKILGEYIWNYEGFNLSIKKSTDELPCHLHGLTNFGDFIEDEWLCVYILLEISKVLPDIICQIHDNDGEFLLIEAAEFLPAWLTPDTALNRVFIHQGMLHIIPKLKENSKLPDVDLTKKVDLQTALFVVMKHPWLTQAHANVLNAIDHRIKQFKDDLNINVQHVNVFIPRPIAVILDANPNFISYAIRSFYYRDQLELRACRVFKKFKPVERIWCQVSMNRCGYAQLMQQNFTADKRSGYVVNKTLGMDFKGHDLGSKIAHGFEMLLNRYRHNKFSNDKEIDEVLFFKYLQKLSEMDYFKGEIEGSLLYKKLFNNARVFYEQNMTYSEVGDNNATEATVYKMYKVLKGAGDNGLLLRCKTAESRESLPNESDDDWMHLNEEDVDNLVTDMNKGFAKMNGKHNEHIPTDVKNLENLPTKMKSFVDKISDYEGIENDNVNFDFDEFSNALEGMLNGNNAESNDESDEFLTSEEDSDSSDEEITTYMEQMDKEISQTKVGESFIKEDTPDKPVDIDVNLVQNFLESHSSSMGLHGPTNSLLNSIGLKLPMNSDI